MCILRYYCISIIIVSGYSVVCSLAAAIVTPPAKATNSALWYFCKFGFLAAVH